MKTKAAIGVLLALAFDPTAPLKIMMITAYNLGVLI